MRIPDAAIEEILRRANIVEVVGEYVALSPKGGRYWGLSPFKPEKTPSFSVNPDKNAYYCFSTSQGGNPISFIMAVEHLNFPEAARFLAKKYGVSIDADAEQDESFKQKQAIMDLYHKLGGSFHHLLVNTSQGKPALDYALHRGLSPEIIASFQLGYTPRDGNWLYKFLTAKSYSTTLLGASGLFSKNHPQYPIFHHRLMFPIMNTTRQTIAFGGRLLEGEGPKYINSPETIVYKKSQTLFGLPQAKDAIKQKGEAIICEGYMDVLALHQGGITNAVAPLGTAFTEEQARQLRLLAPTLTLLFDGDEAGMRATLKSLVMAEGHEFDTNVIVLPDAKDPGDILMRDGSQGIEKIVDYRLPAFEYLLSRTASQPGMLSPEGRERTFREFAPLMRAMVSEIKRESYVHMLADTLSLKPDVVARELMRRQGGDQQVNQVAQRSTSQTVPARPVPQARQSPRSEMEFRLLLATFLHCEHFIFLRNSIPVEDLKDERARELYIALEESYRSGQVTFDGALEKVERAELRHELQRRRLEDEFSSEVEKFIKEGVYRIRQLSLESKRAAIEQQLHRLNHVQNPDPTAIRDLLEEKIILDQTLRDMSRHE